MGDKVLSHIGQIIYSDLTVYNIYHIYIYTYLYNYTYIYIHIYIHIHTHIYIYIYIHIYIYSSDHVYILLGYVRDLEIHYLGSTNILIQDPLRERERGNGLFL